MADASPSQKPAPYQVLARKYRPQRFEDLVGHEAMVRTLKNAFAADRIAHAYILTGVRGVGKTTTARILARALNYVGPDGADAGPTIDMPEEGRHCRAIAESRHPDVFEMDAASRTGVGDIRELIEGVRYAPIEARYKVYIIDEVHMLSTAAFNALLKTLEEPPPHVKFIFATTEIRKVPVTVLSRCQRFDLRRIDPETLTGHLAAIAENEGASVDRDGLWMIARAAEGSVRDALSILDQAILQQKAEGEAGPIGADAIRDMLGVADRAGVWDLVEAAFAGDAKAALDGFRRLYDGGAEPSVVLRDMLEIVHLLSRVKAAGGAAAAHGPAGEAEAERAKAGADRTPVNALTRAWTLLMKGLDECQRAPDPAAAAEMTLIKLCFAADLPTPDEALRALKKNDPHGDRGSRNAPPPAPARDPVAAAPAAELHSAARQSAAQAAPSIRSFDDIIRLAGAKRDARLRTELESFVHLIDFAPGRLAMRLADGAPADLPGRLTQRLKEWTGARWTVSLSAQDEGEKTVRDRRMGEILAHPLVRKTMEVFPGARVTAIRETGAATAAGADGDAPDDAQNEEPARPRALEQKGE